MNLFKLRLAFFMALFILGCSQSPDSTVMETRLPSPESTDARSSPDQLNVPDRILTREGELEFKTNDLNERREMVYRAVSRYNGYISSDKEFNYAGRRGNTFILRVPAKNFDSLLNDVTKGVKEFDTKEIRVKDVTEEFIDIQARLKTKKALEARYAELLKKAVSVKDILEIEKQGGALRSEIESIEGRLNYLQNQISFSTLTATYYENTSGGIFSGDRFRAGLKNGWNNLLYFLIALVNVWPFIIAGFVVIWMLRIYRRRK